MFTWENSGVSMSNLSLDSREKIRSSAKILFATKGINKITVKDIINKAKISRKTFYHYFKSKLDVLASFQEIKKVMDFQGYFEFHFPIFFRLTPQAKSEFFFKGVLELLKKPSAMDLIFVQVLQNEEYLSLLEIDVQECYKQNFEFIASLFKEIGITRYEKRAQLFLFLFDGILLNQSIFRQYKVDYPYDEWLTNTWEELTNFLELNQRKKDDLA